MLTTLDQVSADTEHDSTIERLLELQHRYPLVATEETVRDMRDDLKEELRALIPELQAHPFSSCLPFEEAFTKAAWRQRASRIIVDTEVFAVLISLNHVIPELLHNALMEDGSTVIRRRPEIIPDRSHRLAIAG